MSTFYQQFMHYSVAERRQIAEEAGLSAAYVTKEMYASSSNPKFHFHNAVGLDKATRGGIPFIQHTAGTVDWDYVRRSLNRAHRQGVI